MQDTGMMPISRGFNTREPLPITMWLTIRLLTIRLTIRLIGAVRIELQHYI